LSSVIEKLTPRLP